MNSLLANTTNPAVSDPSHVRLVAVANEAPERDEELLHPSSSDTPSAAKGVTAENFNSNHDELGRFTFDGGIAGGGTQKPTGGTPQAGQAGSIAPGDDTSGGGSQNSDASPTKGASYGGGKSTGKQKGGTQKNAHGASQPSQSKVVLPSKGAGATGVQKPLPGVPRDGPIKGGNPNGTLPLPPEGRIQRYSGSKPYDGKLSSNPYKEDHVSGSCSPALAREAIAQISRMTGKEVLLPASSLAEAIQGSHSVSTRGLSDGSSYGAATVHHLVPILRKHQIACEDLSSKTTDGRSGIERIAAHLHNGPVLVAVSSGSNAHGELIMGRSKNGLYRVYNPSKGGEDMLHASQIDPHGVIALSPSV